MVRRAEIDASSTDIVNEGVQGDGWDETTKTTQKLINKVMVQLTLI